jgi:hypothetical protein
VSSSYSDFAQLMPVERILEEVKVSQPKSRTTKKSSSSLGGESRLLSENGRQEDQERRKRKARGMNSSSNTNNNNKLLGMTLGFEFCSSSGTKKRKRQLIRLHTHNCDTRARAQEIVESIIRRVARS